MSEGLLAVQRRKIIDKAIVIPNVVMEKHPISTEMIPRIEKTDYVKVYDVLVVLGEAEKSLWQLWKERPRLNIFQEAFNAESLLSQYEEYHKAVVSWALKMDKRVFGEKQP